ncbi:MAG: DUF4038 domain-containing protein [Candidatus Omnitrophica bacterium]|nr:DUF4038 domain-containing protein [Candidatus Omnitrophota bacterium]
MLYVQKNVPIEFSLTTGRKYKDIFNEVDVDVIFMSSDKKETKVPAFWKGENEFGVRFAASYEGIYKWQTVCSDATDTDLHNQKGEIKIIPYQGQNPLYTHGRLRISQNKRYLEHSDGTPFFWLADTWWMGFCKRLQWPMEFKELTQDRVQKGFSVIQIVAGLYPDMDWFDERGENEAGYPWTKDFSTINPGYFALADLKLFHLVHSGLIPCIVGCWGYFLPWMGIEKMKKHWRNLIARYGALPVVWCAAGEYDMPYYLSKTGEKDRDFQRKGWQEISRYIRETDPYHNPVTVHPGSYTREVEDFSEVLDFDMLQTGHSDDSIKNTVYRVRQSYNAEPKMPVIDGETVYEGIGGQCREQIQRLTFWSCMLNGAAGHTYGANGIWQINRKEKPFGSSSHGMSWGNTSWEEAEQLPGSKQLGFAKKLLERYDWHLFQTRPDWIEVEVSEENKLKYYYPYVAGIPGKVRIIYLPLFYNTFKIKGIEKDTAYNAFLFNPVTGEEIHIGPVKPGADGKWELPLLTEGGSGWARLPIYQDWVLVLKKKQMRD